MPWLGSPIVRENQPFPLGVRVSLLLGKGFPFGRQSGSFRDSRSALGVGLFGRIVRFFFFFYTVPVPVYWDIVTLGLWQVVTLYVTFSVTCCLAGLCSGLCALPTFHLFGVSTVGIFTQSRVIKTTIRAQNKATNGYFPDFFPSDTRAAEAGKNALIIGK